MNWPRPELFDIVGAVSSFAGGLGSCPQHFSCLVLRDVFGFPAKKDQLKGQGSKGGGCCTQGDHSGHGFSWRKSAQPQKHGSMLAAPTNNIFLLVEKKQETAISYNYFKPMLSTVLITDKSPGK